METTIFIAKLLGVMYLFVGLGLLFNGKYFKTMFKDFMKSSALTYFAGMMLIPAIVAALLYHNIWEGAWYTILVTVFLWLGLLKGAFFVIAPQPIMKMSDWIFKKMNFALGGVLVILMGVLFGYIGFYM